MALIGAPVPYCKVNLLPPSQGLYYAFICHDSSPHCPLQLDCVFVASGWTCPLRAIFWCVPKSVGFYSKIITGYHSDFNFCSPDFTSLKSNLKQTRLSSCLALKGSPKAG